MATTIVRRAVESDVSALTQIQNDGQAKKVRHRDYAWGKEGGGASEQWMRSNVARNEVYVLECDGTPAGMFRLDLTDAHWGPQEPVAVYVHGLSVRNGFNGRGFGRFMLDWCADRASGLNRRYVRLDCPAHNAMLCGYYESVGFVRVGRWAEPGPGGYVWSLFERATH